MKALAVRVCEEPSKREYRKGKEQITATELAALPAWIEMLLEACRQYEHDLATD